MARVLTTPRPFTVDEYYRMAEVGILDPRERVELIEGDIVRMTAIGSRHAGCINRLTRIFVQGLAERAVVHVQNRLEPHSRDLSGL